MVRTKTVALLSIIALFLLFGCSGTKPAYKYELKEVHPVAGRQGQ